MGAELEPTCDGAEEAGGAGEDSRGAGTELEPTCDGVDEEGTAGEDAGGAAGEDDGT